MHVVTVHTTAPLTVIEDGAATALPALVLKRADTYLPGVGVRVLVEQVGSSLYVIGGA